MRHSPLVIGLTGGIGSGKSVVCDHFAQRGIAVSDADIVAREVVEPGCAALAQIHQHFGDDILAADGALNRRRLREIIFAQPAEKTWLEALLHPLINAEIRRQLAGAGGPYVIFVSPLLLETRQFELADRILVIDASEQLQIERATRRDQNAAAQIAAIMQTQLSRQARCARADDIIANHGDIAELDEQVETLHRRYLALAQSTARATQPSTTPSTAPSHRQPKQ